MPLYEYECENCGVRFEVIQKFADAPVETCRACGGKVHRLLSAPAIQFKGTGWYVTDYARKGGGGDSSSSSSSTAGTSKPSSTPASDSGSSSSSSTSTPSSSDKK